MVTCTCPKFLQFSKWHLIERLPNGHSVETSHLASLLQLKLSCFFPRKMLVMSFVIRKVGCCNSATLLEMAMATKVSPDFFHKFQQQPSSENYIDILFKTFCLRHFGRIKEKWTNNPLVLSAVFQILYKSKRFCKEDVHQFCCTRNLCHLLLYEILLGLFTP